MGKIGKAVKRTAISLSVLLSLPVLGIIWIHWTIYGPYNSIEAGMTESEVYEVLGRHAMVMGDREAVPFLFANGYWYGDCEAVMKSNAEYYLTVKVWFETYMIIGFRDDKVISKGMGDA